MGPRNASALLPHSPGDGPPSLSPSPRTNPGPEILSLRPGNWVETAPNDSQGNSAAFSLNLGSPAPAPPLANTSKMSADQSAVSVRGSFNRTEVHNVYNQIGSLTSIPSNSHQWNGVEDSPNLRKESERLKTFDTWPVNFLKSEKLASAGFYYLKRGDKVRCVFCGVEIGDWRPGDDPMGDHARWSDSCPFVNKQPVGNIPLRLAPDNTNSPDSGYDTCGPYDLVKRSQEPNLSEDPKLVENPNYLKTRPPSFPQYASIDARLRSYDTWPISLKLKPNVLSEAGFFYTGKGDQTICYHCGGGLKDWEETDEPWVEHARWFSKCPFVISLKGKSFVDEVCGKKAEEDLKSTDLNSLSLSSSTGDIEKVTTYTTNAISTTTTPAATECKQSTVVEKPEEIEGTSTSSSGSRSSSRGSNEVLLCKICYTEEIGAVFLPCGHMLACLKCALSLSTCAVCRKPVTAFFRAFFS